MVIAAPLRRGACAGVLWLGCALAACATAVSSAKLENTYWKLLHAGGAAVVVEEGQREPHVVLHPARGALAGYTGCNRIGVGYTLDGPALSFAPIAAPLAACPSAVATRQQGALLQALARTARWRVAGERLELLDSAGRVLAGFESVYLR